MKRISSASTAFYKRVAPLLLAGLLVGAAFALVGESSSTTTFELLALSAVAFLLALMHRLFVMDMADAVYDCGEHLQIWRGRSKADVPLSDILWVRTSMPGLPERITLGLATITPLGRVVTFEPRQRLRLNLLSASGVARSLRDKARRLRGVSRLD